jgi:malate/lactate dehydrogenase
VINRDGVARVLPIPLNDAEKQALRASAEVLKQHFSLLEVAQGTAS